MPTSAPYALSTIASLARQLRPQTVLDVGIGFGKYGFLLREYLDVWEADDVGGCRKDRWKTRIDGIEATPEYITPVQEYVYDHIHIGDATHVIPTLGRYDMIVMGDVLEHFEKKAGETLLDDLYAHTDQCLVLAFPPDCNRRDGKFSNPFEAHRSKWNRRDFTRFPQLRYRVVEGSTAVVALTKPPHRQPILTPSFAGRRRTGWKAFAGAALVRTMGRNNASRLLTFVCRAPIQLTA